jgi:hypothetical protein
MRSIWLISENKRPGFEEGKIILSFRNKFKESAAAAARGGPRKKHCNFQLKRSNLMREKISIKDEDYIYLLFNLHVSRNGCAYWFHEFYEQDHYHQSPVQTHLWLRDAFRHPDPQISRYAFLADGKYFTMTVEKSLWHTVIKEKIREVAVTEPFKNKYYGFVEGKDYIEFPTFEAMITHVGKYFQKLRPLEASIIEKERYKTWLDTLLEKNVLPTSEDVLLAQQKLLAEMEELKTNLREVLQNYLTIESLTLK